MTKQKSTKRALLLSALSLLMCVSMLIGSTYAWFTDTASTGVNTIQSGTLQVDLQDSVSNSLEGKTLTFVQKTENGETTIASPLWEPGATFITQQFKVVNNGNLNLKYTIVITGIDGDAKLNEVMEWSVVEGDTEVTTLTGTLAPGAATPLMNLKGHMKEEATNEYQGLSMSGVGITVYATQVEAEYDSFNNTYDKNAAVNVTDSATLNTAIKNAVPGTTIMLADGNYELGANDAFTNSNADKDITLIGGKDAVISKLLVCDDMTNVTFVGLTISEFDLTGPVTLENVKFSGCSFVANGADYAINVPKQAGYSIKGLVFENCFFAGYTGSAIYINNTANEGIVITGNTFDNIGHNAVNFSNKAATANEVVITGNTISNCADRAIRISAENGNLKINNNVINNAVDGGNEAVKISGSVTFVEFNGNTYAGTALTLADANEKGELIAFAAN